MKSLLTNDFIQDCFSSFVQLLPVHMLRLGVELDSFDGHHYISSLAPGGPVEKHGVLRPEDELLEVKSGSSLKTVYLTLNMETEYSKEVLSNYLIILNLLKH